MSDYQEAMMMYPQQQRIYDHYREAPPETRTRSLAAAYWLGRDGHRSRYDRSSLAHAAWRAGYDTRPQR